MGTNRSPEIANELNTAFHRLGGAAIIGLTKQNGEPVLDLLKAYEEAYTKGENGALGPTKLREMIAKRNALQKAYLDRWSCQRVMGKVRWMGLFWLHLHGLLLELELRRNVLCELYWSV